MLRLQLLLLPISVLIGEGMGCSPTSMLASFQSYRPNYFEVRECGQRPLWLDHRRRKRVTDGEEAVVGQWPWHISLKGKEWCSGVLIDSAWVATAAHCVYDIPDRLLQQAANLTVTAGSVVRAGRDAVLSEKSQTRGVSNIYLHPKYANHVKDTIPISYDFALLKLSEPFDIGPMIQTACIHLEENAFSAGDSDCYVAGWGKQFRSNSLNSADVLQYSRVPLFTKENCSRYAASVSRYQLSLVTDEKLCAGTWSRDLIYGPCKGDSGGPLVCLERNSRSWYVVGIVSHGKKCGEVSFYTKIYSMLGYIEEVISGSVTDDQFECADGLASIPYERECDGVPDCRDMTDEIKCECSEHQIRCDNDVCRLASDKCDAVDDCGDGSDEIDCEYFECRRNRNISLDQVCDGENDCEDWSDEHPSTCDHECDESTHFQCPTGPCIPLSWRCDGKTDCEGNDEQADEVDCVCREGYFSCNNSQCVHNNTVCDGPEDCSDGSDERNCPPDVCSGSRCMGLCIEKEDITCDAEKFETACQDYDPTQLSDCLK